MASDTSKRRRSGRFPASLPKLCITATGHTLKDLIGCARTALSQSQFIELRLDWLPRPADAIPHIANLFASSPGAVIQATCRRKPNGGEFVGSVPDQLRILLLAVEAGCRLVDVEMESAEESADGEAKALFDDLRARAGVIVSFHDFQRTPPLAPVVKRLQKIPADIYKLVPTALEQTDVVRLLQELRELTTAGVARWVGFAMGQAGVPSRVLALSRGSAFIYAAPASPEPLQLAAPGQLDADLLRRRFRADRISVKTKLFGVLGNPVKHSIGTAVHNACLSAIGLDAVYLPLQSEDVRQFRKAALDYPLSGFSITLPHKQAILRYVDKPDKLVKAVGAANTVRQRNGKWEAINSDVAGIMQPLRAHYQLGETGKLPAEFSALVLGNGGAARAAIVGLQALGCRRISVSGRNLDSVGVLAKEFKAAVVPLAALNQHQCDLLIQATSVGMWPASEASPITPAQICAATVFDLIYNPQETKLLQMARAKGCAVIQGIEMYLAQAARQFEYWTGKKPPLARMRRAALDELELMRHAGARR
jgi:3-dehydroquinate dehydratase/shikimate dehydrogenase